MYTVLREKCIICGSCIIFCREKAIIVKDKKAFILSDLCTGCQVCVGKCLTRAIVKVDERN